MEQTDIRLLSKFESVMLPHLDAAHNLARWLTRDEHDAADVVQEAMVRALRGFHGFHGGDARCWLLKVVRNTCMSWLRKNRAAMLAPLPDDASDELSAQNEDAPTLIIRAADVERLRGSIEELPGEFREAFVLRELEGLSYKEIAQVAEVPVGTVMSRLARARRRLQEMLSPSMQTAED